MIEVALRQILINDVDVKAIAKDRVRPNELLQNETLPAVAFFLVDDEEEFCTDGPEGTQTAEYQFDCIGKSTAYPELDRLKKAVKDALNGYTGAVNVGSDAAPKWVSIDVIAYKGGVPAPQPDNPDLKRKSISFLVVFRED
jgi:hypothetical protein